MCNKKGDNVGLERWISTKLLSEALDFTLIVIFTFASQKFTSMWRLVNVLSGNRARNLVQVIDSPKCIFVFKCADLFCLKLPISEYLSEVHKYNCEAYSFQVSTFSTVHIQISYPRDFPISDGTKILFL